MGQATDDSRCLPKQVVLHRRGGANGTKWCQQSVAGTQRVQSEWCLHRALRQEGKVVREMVGAICSPAELSKCVGMVVASGVDGFVGTVCLDLPEEQEVPKVTNCSKTI